MRNSSDNKKNGISDLIALTVPFIMICALKKCLPSVLFPLSGFMTLKAIWMERLGDFIPLILFVKVLKKFKEGRTKP